MKRIKSVRIKGFKSHLDSVFTYAPGLTVVTGPSDCGKSAGVIQPIKWVAFGEPAGESFLFTIRDSKGEIVKQAEQGEVEITLEDGTVVMKTRRKGKTTYYMNGKLISEKADVPEEVKEALGLSKQEYGDFETSLNFAYQLEAPFILSETASVGAKVLGKLAGTEVVDKAIAAIMKRTYKAREDKSLAQKIIDQANVELIEYLQIEDVVAQVETCERLITELDKDIQRADNIKAVAAKQSTVYAKIKECEVLLDKLTVVKELDNDLREVENVNLLCDSMNELYSRMSALKIAVTQTENDLQALKDVKTASNLMGTIEKLYGDFTESNKHYVDYLSLKETLGKLDIFLQRFTELTKSAETLQAVEQDNETYERLVSLNGNVVVLNGRIEEVNALLEKCRDLEAANRIVKDTETTEQRVGVLQETVGRHKTLDGNLKRLEGQLETLKGITEAQKALQAIDDTYGRFTALKSLMDDYRAKYDDVNRAEKTHAMHMIALEEANDELQAAWDLSGGICPLCEQPYSAGHEHKGAQSNV